MTESAFREITRIRVNLEGLATEQAAQQLPSDALERIAALQDRFAAEMASASPDGARLIAFNKDFHFAVYGAAGMPLLLQMIEALGVRIGPILNHDMRSGSRRVSEQVAVGHHARLVEALRRGDAPAAKQALRGDIESAADYIVSAGVLVTADSGLNGVNGLNGPASPGEESR
jgi:DNA-binding GntR family transcriptional regulator